MKKILSFTMMLALVCGSASARTWYADPASTNKSAAGTSWEQAVTISNLRKAFSAFGAGDTIFVKGGTIQLEAITDRWDITRGITIIGGFDPNATGTVTALPHYPSATPTIISGDINKDGKPSSGDAPALIRVNFENDLNAVFVLQGFDLVNTYYDNIEEAEKDLETYMAESSALRIICGTAYVKNCHIYNHITPNNRGSQCVTVVGAKAHLMDCELHDCICLSRGALVRSRSYFIGKVESNPILPSLVLERCCLYNANNMGGDGQTVNTAGEYGGAVHVSTGDVFGINCTFVNNTTYSKGGAVRAAASGSVPSNIAFISCTFGNNYSARSDHEGAEKANSYGSSFGLDSDCSFKLANTFVVDDKDNGKKRYVPFYTDKNTKSIDQLGKSGGYNVFGTIFFVVNGAKIEDLSSFYQPTDIYATTGVHFFDYFGTMSRFTDNGGCSKTILPQQMQNGDNVAHLQELADNWFPTWTKVDASLDQRGAKRDSLVTCVGAAAFEAEAPMGLEELRAAFESNNPAVYNLLGMPVGESYKGVVIQKGKKYLLQ